MQDVRHLTRVRWFLVKHGTGSRHTGLCFSCVTKRPKSPVRPWFRATRLPVFNAVIPLRLQKSVHQHLYSGPRSNSLDTACKMEKGPERCLGTACNFAGTVQRCLGPVCKIAGSPKRRLDCACKIAGTVQLCLGPASKITCTFEPLPDRIVSRCQSLGAGVRSRKPVIHYRSPSLEGCAGSQSQIHQDDEGHR